MTCVQLGLAASVALAREEGPLGVAWLRLAWAGVVLVLLGRPWRLRLPRRTLIACVQLGVVTAGMTTLFMGAVDRVPLGTAVALEFLGPLTLATLGGGRGRAVWPLLAAAGVLLLTRPWSGGADPVGVMFALTAAGCWAGYILLTQRVGAQATGLSGLAVSMPVAAVVASVAVALAPGTPLWARLTPAQWLLGLGLALLLPVLPFTLELLALRRLDTATFGTLMSLEPAIALVVGLLLLGQAPAATGALGIALVVVAGIGAERTGAAAANALEAAEAQPSAPAG